MALFAVRIFVTDSGCVMIKLVSEIILTQDTQLGWIIGLKRQKTLTGSLDISSSDFTRFAYFRAATGGLAYLLGFKNLNTQIR